MTKFKTITIPVHPDEENVPVSIVHIPLADGRYATIRGPLAPKTMGALIGTLLACKDCIVAKLEDFQI